MTKDTGRARLPGLVAPRVDNPDLARWVQAVAERLEVREGARGNPYERAVTVRDLTEGGIAVVGGGGRLVSGGASAPGGPGGPDPDYEIFWENLKNSSLYRELMKRLDDPTRFDYLADEVKAVLLRDIAEEARLRGADVRRLETKIQTETRSLAMSVEEVTAAVQDAAAGVRFTQVAQADADTALAAQITQVQANLDGKVAGVEQTLRAISSTTDGLKAEYFVKVQAGGAFGGFGLSAVSPADPSKPTYSQFLIAADRFALISPDGKLNPFGVDVANSAIYLNGKVRINAGGTPIEDLNTGITLSAPGQVFNVSNTGAITPDSITVKAKLNGSLAGRSMTFSTTPPNIGTQNGRDLTIPASAFATNTTVKVTATATAANGTAYSDEFTLYKVVDGADALVGFLTNESHGLPANGDGTVTSYAGASGEMVVFKGGKRQTTGVLFSLGANPNRLIVNINASTGAYSVTGGLTSDSATVTFRAVVGGATLEKVFTLTRQKDGATGRPGDPGEEGPRGSLTGYSNTIPNRTIPLQGPSWDANRAAHDQYAALIILYMVKGSTDPWPTDSPFGSGLSAAQKAHLRIGDTVTLSNADKAATRYWSGMGWVDVGVIIDGNLLVKGTVSADKIAAMAITADKIAAGAITADKVAAGSITAEKLAAGSITADAIASSVSQSRSGMRFGFGTNGGTAGYVGAGFFESTANNTYGLAAVKRGDGAAFAASHTSDRNAAALFNHGSSDYVRGWTTAAKICALDEIGWQPTAGVFMHGSNRGNTALLGRQDQAGYFQAAGGASSVSLAQGSYALTATGSVWLGGAVDISGSLKINGVEVKPGGGGSVDGKDILPNSVVSSGRITSYGNNGTTYVGAGSHAGYPLGFFTTLSAQIREHLSVVGNVLIDGSLQVKGRTLAFTGAHPGLLGKADMPVVGDILVDHRVAVRLDVSNTISIVRPSTSKNQKGVIGVFAGENGTMPATLSADGNIGGDPDPKFAHLLATHSIIDINSVGEGQINVCGEGGDLEIGDLIVASSMPGKGMRQSDDLVRSYTVAKVRENVKFSSPTEVKQVACIYLCG